MTEESTQNEDFIVANAYTFLGIYCILLKELLFCRVDHNCYFELFCFGHNNYEGICCMKRFAMLDHNCYFGILYFFEDNNSFTKIQ